MAGGFFAALVVASLGSRLTILPSAVVAPVLASCVVAAVVWLRPTTGIAIFLILAVMTQTLERWLEIDLRYLDESSVLAILAVSTIRNWARVRGLRPGWQEGALATAVVAGAMASLVNQVPIGVWAPALGLFVKGAVFFYAVSWFAAEIDDLQRVGVLILAFVLTVAALGFLELADPVLFQRLTNLPPFSEVRGGVQVVKSVFVHPAIFGWLTAYGSLFLYARFFVLREWWALGLAVLLSVGTLLSGRRRPVAGVLAALVAGAVWLWRRRGSPRTNARILAPLALALLVIAILSAPGVSSFYAGTVGEYLGAGDLGEILEPHPDPAVVAGAHPRMALYVGSAAIARDFFPWGAGLGRFGSYMSEAQYSPLYARYGLTQVYGLGPDNPVAISDTYWPMVLGETGILGMAGMIVFLGLVTIGLWRRSQGFVVAASRAFALGALFVMLEGLVGSLTAPTYVASPIAYWVFGAAAAVGALARSAHDRGDPHPGATIPLSAGAVEAK
jgi:hypothetical protein